MAPPNDDRVGDDQSESMGRSDDGDGANHADRYLEGPYMKAARRKRSSMDVSAPNLPDGA